MTETPTTWPDLSAHGLSLWLVETRCGPLVALSGEPVGVDAVALAATGLAPVEGRRGLRVAAPARTAGGEGPGHRPSGEALATAFPGMRTVPFSHGLHHVDGGKGPTAGMRFPDTSAARPGAVSTWRGAATATPGGRAPRSVARAAAKVLEGHVRVGDGLHEVWVQEVDGDVRIVLGNALPSATRRWDLWPSATLVAVEAARAASADMALGAFASGLAMFGKGVDGDVWHMAAPMGVRRANRAGEGRSERLRLDCGGADVVLSRDLDGFDLALDGGVGEIRTGPTWDVLGLLRAANTLTSNRERSLACVQADAMMEQARDVVRRAAAAR